MTNEARAKMPPWARRLVALLLVGTAIALYFTYRGNELGRIRVGDEPRMVHVNPEPGKPLVFWTEVELRNESHSHRVTSELPHLLDYELRCNPFNSNIFRWSSERRMTNRSYLGRIRACSVDAPDRNLTIRAHRVWRNRDPAFRFEKTILVIEQ